MIISKKCFIILLGLMGCVLFSGCISTNPETLSGQSDTMPDPSSVIEGTGIVWMTMPLTDVTTGDRVSMAELSGQGKPVILHIIAAWCPGCSKQLRESSDLIQDNPNRYIILALDIDPRESAELLRNHKAKNKYEGIFVTAPIEFTRSLIKTVNPQIGRSMPQTILIQNQSVTFLGDGVFSGEELQTVLSE